MSYQPREEEPARLLLDRWEAALLAQILRIYLSDLRMEIADTDSMDFRLGLKQEEGFIKELLARLGEPLTPDAG